MVIPFEDHKVFNFYFNDHYFIVSYLNGVISIIKIKQIFSVS